MYDATASYRSSQVVSSSPLAQVVLLYQGAIRFGMQHLAALERRDWEAAHNASIRSQAIVSGLQEVLDMSAGPIAAHLDQLYEFALERLVAGNVAKDPRPTEEALRVLRGLLEAWQAINRPAAAQDVATVPVPEPVRRFDSASAYTAMVAGSR